MITDTDKQIIYGISYSTYTPFAMYINDILAAYSYDNYNHNTNVKVNPYVLRSGTYQLKVIFYPPSINKDGLLHSSDMDFTNIQLGKLVGENYTGGIKKFTIPKLTNPVPYAVLEDTFTVDLPYELEGWEHSRVFAPRTTQDSAALIRQLVAYYNTLRQEINSGELDKFFSRYKQSDAESSVYRYMTLQDIHNEEATMKEDMKKEAVGNMVPIEDYELNIFAQGRILTLLRKATTEVYGQKINLRDWAVLIWNSKNEIAGVGPKVHMPAGSNSFEIIRD